jgi:E3 ubiquitin-protein ligase SIAH1
LLSQLTVSGKIQFVRRLEGYNAKGFLFVPDAFWGSSGTVTVTVYL